ncbi:MAG: hypothetical protein EVJ48_01925 [Candidatus Acidulodesulfobacterium acidiphilum]|uniref:Uncharacterized protein n=1 Tax=Candidatus Acidulodesulfobacterium acidiphilum TaxID=2597224 RepID=A0A520XGE5_9DELT|nr:MAG: hypothetical protein EVJ48_01925 [Candidatus Acidulodesulfobacterium acidiphilum]
MKNKKAILKILKEVKSEINFDEPCEKNCLLTLIFMKFLSEQQEKKVAQGFTIESEYLFKNILEKVEESIINFRLLKTEPVKILQTLDNSFITYNFDNKDLVFQLDCYNILGGFYEILRADLEQNIFQEIETRIFNMAKIVNKIEILNLLDDRKVDYKDFLKSLSAVY